MPVPLPQYAEIKDNYCIAYYGDNREYIVQLKILRPTMEKTFPGIKVYLSCKNNYMYLLKGEQRIIQFEELDKNRNLFGYIRTIKDENNTHPIENFMKESDIEILPIKTNTNPSNKKCVIISNGIEPVRSLTGDQIKKLYENLESKGFDIFLNIDFSDAGLVVGVENENLYLAAESGINTNLIVTGFGENLFKKMFPECNIYDL
jgi:hypothetical protein